MEISHLFCSQQSQRGTGLNHSVSRPAVLLTDACLLLPNVKKKKKIRVWASNCWSTETSSASSFLLCLSKPNVPSNPCCASTQETRDARNKGAKMWHSVTSRNGVSVCQQVAEKLKIFFEKRPVGILVMIRFLVCACKHHILISVSGLSPYPGF